MVSDSDHLPELSFLLRHLLDQPVVRLLDALHSSA
jgi:hypothetical protein